MSINSTVEALKESMKQEIRELHTAMPGIIQSYDASTGLADVKPAVNRNIEGSIIEYSVITGVPVSFPSGIGGEVSITWPIQKGDGCLLIFAESQIDEWLLGIQSNDSRQFDLTDAICIPGLSKNGYRALKDNPKTLTIKYKGNSITIGEKIEINGDLHVNGKITSTG